MEHSERPNIQNLNVLLEVAVKCSVICVCSASDALSLFLPTTYLKQRCDIVLIKHVGMNLELDCKLKKKQHAELCNMHFMIIL